MDLVSFDISKISATQSLIPRCSGIPWIYFFSLPPSPSGADFLSLNRILSSFQDRSSSSDSNVCASLSLSLSLVRSRWFVTSCGSGLLHVWLSTPLPSMMSVSLAPNAVQSLISCHVTDGLWKTWLDGFCPYLNHAYVDQPPLHDCLGNKMTFDVFNTQQTKTPTTPTKVQPARCVSTEINVRIPTNVLTRTILTLTCQELKRLSPRLFGSFPRLISSYHVVICHSVSNFFSPDQDCC